MEKVTEEELVARIKSEITDALGYGDTIYTDANAVSAVSTYLPAIKQARAAGNYLLPVAGTEMLINSLTVTPPSDGYIYVNASGIFSFLATGSTIFYSGAVSLSVIDR